MLSVRNLYVNYGAIAALRGVSLDVDAGCIVTLIGTNGAGKTTLLRTISGLLRPRSGSLTFTPDEGKATHGGSPPGSEKACPTDAGLAGLPVDSEGKSDRDRQVSPSRNGSSQGLSAGGLGGRAPSTDSEVNLAKESPHEIVRRGVIHVPEGRGIFSNLTVAENLQLGAYLRHDEGVERDREHVLSLFPRLRERFRQSAGTLSGGEQQMLAIARGLMARPVMLLLDEPSLGLAPRLVQQIFEMIRKINESGTTILLVEQNAHMALQVAHYAYCLETGTVALEGPASAMAERDEVKKAYLGG